MALVAEKREMAHAHDMFAMLDESDGIADHMKLKIFHHLCEREKAACAQGPR